MKKNNILVEPHAVVSVIVGHILNGSDKCTKSLLLHAVEQWLLRKTTYQIPLQMSECSVGTLCTSLAEEHFARNIGEIKGQCFSRKSTLLTFSRNG